MTDLHSATDPSELSSGEQSVTRGGGGPARTSGSGTSRQFGSRSPLLTSRAAIGALLVAAAAIGTYAAARPAAQPTPPSWLVAAADLPPGAAVSDSTTAAAPLPLPEEVAERAFPADSEIDGQVLAVALEQGDLLLRSHLQPSTDSPVHDLAQIAVSIAPGQALGGSLRVGDIVDLVGTTGIGGDATTGVLARRATVLSFDSPDSTGLAGTGEMSLTLAVAPSEVLDVAHTSVTGALQVVRNASGSPTSSGGTGAHVMSRATDDE